MALVKVGDGFYLDMTYLNIGGLASGTTTFANSSHMTLTFDQSTRDEFFGSFTYGPNGILAGGTLTGIQEYINNEKAFEFSGISAPVSTFRDWIASGDTATAEAGMLAGNDSLAGGSFSDALLGFDGNDTMFGGASFDALNGGTGDDSIDGGTGNDFIIGMEGNDFVYGGEGDDDVNGNMGDDTVRGGEGEDFVRGGKGNDYVLGDDGDDPHVNGNLGDDQVYGGEGNDSVYGGQGDDHLDGQEGNDLVSGDLGDDTLTGGAGADGFLIGLGGGHDVATDFNSAQGDRVLLWQGTQYSLQSDAAGNAVVVLQDGSSLTLVGVSQANLGDWLQYLA